MTIRTISQPEVQFGKEVDELLDQNVAYRRIVFVSAFVALRTILRLRERLLVKKENGAGLRLTVGIDLGGTSCEVLEEFLRWNCETLVFHNAIARATFHPKVYLFESASSATLFVGSNNLTDGGLYTNYEAATRYDFDLPADEAEYRRLVGPLAPFLEAQGPIVQKLTAQLIETLVARGELPSEAQARKIRRENARGRKPTGEDIPANPFASAPVPLPPLLEHNLRREEPAADEDQAPEVLDAEQAPGTASIGVLVWRKILTKSDASDVKPGTHPKAQVVLSQAGFENPPGHPINQMTYFRNLFRDFHWEQEAGKHADQEHTFARFRVRIRGQDYGIRNLEVSHKPSGEAEQKNSPTVLRWGGEFNPIIRHLGLTGATFSLFELSDDAADFLIEITN
jgi:HKD family nuclease